MKKTKQIICEERKFLRLCSEPYKDMIRRRREMPLEYFLIICSALSELELKEYFAYFIGDLFSDLLNQWSELDEKIQEDYDLEESWDYDLHLTREENRNMLRKFWEQLPLESQKKKYRTVFDID